MSLRIQVLSAEGSFAVLEDAWRQLDRRDSTAAVFTTWEWLSTWWRYYGAGKELALITAWDEDQLVGILPSYRWRRRALWLLPIRELRLVGSGGDTSPDYLGPVFDDSYRASASLAIARFLAQDMRGWDVLRFSDLAASDFADDLLRALDAAGGRRSLSTDSEIRLIRLPQSWNAYLQSISGPRRRAVQYSRKVAVQKLNAVLHVRRAGPELRDAVDDLIRLHRSRWEHKAKGAGAFASDAYVGFHREVIERCSANDWIRLYSLDIADKAVAIVYCYRYRAETLHFQSGFDPTYRNRSVGRVALAHAIEQSIEEGSTVFDMLKGDHDYKAKYANDQRRTLRLLAFRGTARGVAAGLLSMARDRWKAWRRISVPEVEAP